MKPSSFAGEFDRVAGNALVVAACLLVLSIPFFGLFGIQSGPQWVIESRIQIAGGCALTLVALAAGCALRRGKVGRKLVCLLAACGLASAFIVWYPVPFWTIGSIAVVGAVGVSIGLDPKGTCVRVSAPRAAARAVPRPEAVGATNGECSVVTPVTGASRGKATTNLPEPIVWQPNGPGGEHVLGEEQIPVRTVWSMLAKGSRADDILAAYPSLTSADVQAAISFAALQALAASRGRQRIEASVDP